MAMLPTRKLRSSLEFSSCARRLREGFFILTKKAEPPPTRDENRDSGTASANGGWLRRLVSWRLSANKPIQQNGSRPSASGEQKPHKLQLEK
jgi:hypothetical protein